MDSVKRKVAVIGALNVDIGAWPDSPPERGDSIPGRVSTALGGVGWNIARDCAMLGVETAFFSCLGRDEHAHSIREEGARHGIDMTGCRWADEPNNRYVYICDETGDVAAAVNDMRLCAQMGPEFAESCLLALNGCGAVVADANLPAETLAFLAGHLTAPLAADGVSAAKCVRLRGILHRLHTLKANLLEAEVLTGETGPEACARALLEAGVRRAVISLGAEGMLCAEGDVLFHQPGVPGTVADATGAGDALTAALAVGLAQGKTIKECVELGAAAAAITMAHPGSVTENLRALAK